MTFLNFERARDRVKYTLQMISKNFKTNAKPEKGSFISMLIISEQYLIKVN